MAIKNSKKEIVEKQMKHCIHCNKERPVSSFYNSKNRLFADGKMPVCKDCIKSLIDYEKMETIYDLLKQLDVPFLYEVWSKAEKSKGATFGNYIRITNSLPQYEGLTWKDSIMTSEEGIPYKKTREDVENEEYRTKLKHDTMWRGMYTQEDLDYLNNYLKQLKTDFKIITVNHMDYAKKIAKTSLLMDKSYEDILAGVSGAEKRFNDLQKTFDTLSKSAQFSENTRGANDVTLGCFGVIFDKVEQHKWIDTHVPMEKDEFDKLIEYFATINKSV